MLPVGSLTRLDRSTGIRSAYTYDAADRVTAVTHTTPQPSAPPVPVATPTPAPDAKGSAAATACTGVAGYLGSRAAYQLTASETSGRGRGVSAGTASYSYDAAGNRVDQTVAGVSTRFAYNPAGQTTEVAREGRTTSYGYDGLGRNTSVTDQTRYGTSTTRTVFDGFDPVQQSAQAGTTTLIRDALGSLAEHVTEDGTATWDLLDRLGSTVAGASGGSITQLSSYDDWGAQRFETGAWSAGENFTGESTDPTEGLNHYYARSYDPAAAVWTSADPYRGLLTQPQSLHRYAYAWNNPSTDIDLLGNACAKVNPRSDALPLGCGAPPVQAHDNVKPPAPPKPPITKDDPKNPEPKDPKSKSDVQDRHVEEDQKRIREQLALWGNILGVISGALGLAALFMGPLAGPIAAVASGVLGLAGVILGCMATGIDADCVVNAILALVPAGASAVTIGLRGVLRPIVRDAIDAFGALIGALSGWKSAGSIWPAVR